MIALHRVDCRSCEGTGNASRACRCAARFAYGSARDAYCSCDTYECEDCNGRGTVPCEELVCEVCEEIEATATGLRRAATGL
jgi:hypothetical protein